MLRSLPDNLHKEPNVPDPVPPPREKVSSSGKYALGRKFHRQDPAQRGVSLPAQQKKQGPDQGALQLLERKPPVDGQPAALRGRRMATRAGSRRGTRSRSTTSAAPRKKINAVTTRRSRRTRPSSAAPRKQTTRVLVADRRPQTRSASATTTTTGSRRNRTAARQASRKAAARKQVSGAAQKKTKQQKKKASSANSSSLRTRSTRNSRSKPLNIDLFNLKTPGKKRKSKGVKAAAADNNGKKKGRRNATGAAGRKRRSRRIAADSKEDAKREEEEKGDKSSSSEVSSPPQKRSKRIPVPREEEYDRRWTQVEVRALLEGVEELGEGQWAEILGAYQDILINRTPSDLRMKYRNLLIKQQREHERAQRIAKHRPAGRKKPVRWGVEETELLLDLVHEFEPGRWKQILEAGGGEFHESRTPTNLKDKWRSIQQAQQPKKTAKKKRIYRLLHSDGVIFRNRYPRDAALKAATRGWPRIALLDLSSEQKMVHLYTGRRVRKEVRDIADQSFAEEKFGKQNYYWVPHVQKIGVRPLGIYLKEGDTTMPVLPNDIGRANRGGRPHQLEEEEEGEEKKRRKGRTRKAKKSTRKGRTAGSRRTKRGIPIPDDQEKDKDVMSEEETHHRVALNKVLKGFSFLFTRLNEATTARLSKLIKKMGGKVVGTVSEAISEEDLLFEGEEEEGGSVAMVVAPRPLMTRKFLYALARGLLPFHPDFLNECKRTRGLADPLKYACNFPRTKMSEAMPRRPKRDPDLIKRKGLQPLGKESRLFYGYTFASFNLKQDQQAVLRAAGAELVIIDRISKKKVPRRVEAVISGQREVYYNGFSGLVISFMWVAECLVAQKYVAASEELLCDELDDE
eukprot:jgi/Bigna1/76227/fgenesh1_pg.40_\